MIKLPKEISAIFKLFAQKGLLIYAVGGCVRDSLIGEKPIDWDLTTEGTLEEILNIFPEAEVISEKYQVVRLDYSDENGEGLTIDIARMRKERNYDKKGNPEEVIFTNLIEEDLKRRDYTVNAMAENPSKGFLDPYSGRDDLKKKIIRSVGDPIVRFNEDPIRIMRGVRIAAELGFDISKKDYEAMMEVAPKLQSISVDKVRSEFKKIIIAEHAGSGLRMLAGADIMPAIIGDIAYNLSSRQKELFSILADNIDKTQKNTLRRMGLFYLCFERKKGLKAIEVLKYDNKTIEHLTDALTMLDRLYFLRKGVEIKEWLFKYGEDRFYYMHDLTKAQRIVYNLSEVKIASRHYVLKDIETRKEPVFVEDLAINGQDLIDAGIVQGEQVGDILIKLVDVVHRRPDKNNKTELTAYAKKFAKNPLLASTRKVKWIR